MNTRPHHLLALGMLAGAVGTLAVAAATAPAPEPISEPITSESVTSEPSPPAVTPAPAEADESVIEPPVEASHRETPPTEGRIEFEDGSWRDPDGTTGCYDGALCSLPPDYPHDTTPDVADPSTDLPDWRAIFEADGFVVGDVIVCPPPLEVAIDRYPDGTTWASCQ